MVDYTPHSLQLYIIRIAKRKHNERKIYCRVINKSNLLPLQSLQLPGFQTIIAGLNKDWRIVKKEKE